MEISTRDIGTESRIARTAIGSLELIITALIYNKGTKTKKYKNKKSALALFFVFESNAYFAIVKLIFYVSPKICSHLIPSLREQREEDLSIQTLKFTDDLQICGITVHMVLNSKKISMIYDGSTL